MEKITNNIDIALLIVYILSTIVLIFINLKWKNRYKNANQKLINLTGADTDIDKDLYVYYEHFKDYQYLMNHPEFKSKSTPYKNGVLVERMFIDKCNSMGSSPAVSK